MSEQTIFRVLFTNGQVYYVVEPIKRVRLWNDPGVKVTAVYTVFPHNASLTRLLNYRSIVLYLRIFSI